MSNLVNTNATKPAPTTTDSLFGMVLAQAFTAFAYGPLIDQVWDAAEVASEAYEDRMASKKRANGRVFELGVSSAIAEDFGRMATGSADSRCHRPLFAPVETRDWAAPALAA